MDKLLDLCNQLHEWIAVQLYYVPLRKKALNALKVGLLSTDTVDPSSLIHPASISCDVILYGIASSDLNTSQRLARQHGFQKSYESYDALLADLGVDFVYIALPTVLHFEWAFKALESGKHVLLDKPLSSNSLEASELLKQARRTGKILMEAVHSQFHPSLHRLRDYLDDQAMGRVLSVAASTGNSTLGRHFSNENQWQYHCAGGSLLSMSEILSLCHFALRLGLPEEVLQTRATTTLDDPRVDTVMKAMLRYRRVDPGNLHDQAHDLIVNISTSLSRTRMFGLIPRFWELPTLMVETEKAEIVFYNLTSPHLFHYITIKDKTSRKWTYDSLYKGGPLWKDRGGTFWSTHCYQLEAFVDRMRGRDSVSWVANEESLMTLETIDAVYRKAGLPMRPTGRTAVISLTRSE